MAIFSKEEVIIISYSSLPDEICEALSNRHAFHNDCYLEHISELSPYGDQTWADTLSIDKIISYHADQCARTYVSEYNKPYTKSVEEFIVDYNLIIDKWLIDSGYDFTNIKKILFRICW